MPLSAAAAAAALPGHQSIFKLSERQAPEEPTPISPGPEPGLHLGAACGIVQAVDNLSGLVETTTTTLPRDGCDGAARQLHTHVNHTPRWPPASNPFFGPLNGKQNLIDL